ncbi:MAG: amino acid--tRNA ligase-related protein, partial [Nannocystaceae bacterium]
MSERPPLHAAQRVAVWDAALHAVRTRLRAAGLREVVTPVRLGAVAIEPFIEPIAAPPGLLATSPELPMKRLLCRGAPSIFQIAPCFRASEHGPLHREEFHMVEWYRVGDDTPALRGDVEGLVGAVHEAVAGVLDEPAVAPPAAWMEVGALPLMAETLGVPLRGDEDAQALGAALRPVSARLGDPLASVPHGRLAATPRAHALAAWTAMFSAWCDVCLDPWLSRHDGKGVHL